MINTVELRKIKIVPIYLLFKILVMAYLAITIKYYLKYKNAGLLDDENSNKYLKHLIMWPIYTNPFRMIFESFFKNYGDNGVTYLGWSGFKNFYHDITKGKNRYSKINPIVFNIKLARPPSNGLFGTANFARIILAKTHTNFLYCCNLSPEKFENDQWSNYELDCSILLTKDELSKELKDLYLSKDNIKDILQKL